MEKLKGLLFFLRFGQRPAGVDEWTFTLFRPLAENLVKKGHRGPGEALPGKELGDSRERRATQQYAGISQATFRKFQASPQSGEDLPRGARSQETKALKVGKEWSGRAARRAAGDCPPQRAAALSIPQRRAARTSEGESPR